MQSPSTPTKGNLSPAILEMARQTRAVIVHYGDRSLTAGALASIGRGSVRPGFVAVVDNGPPGMELQTADYANSGIDVVVVAPGRNTGFAGGVRLGLRTPSPIDTRYVWLFNNDAQSDPDALAELLEAHGRIGDRSVVSSLILNSKTNAIWFENAVFLPWRLDCRHVAYRGPAADDVVMDDSINWRSVRYLPGCSLLAPITVFDEVGDLDDAFFIYGEDVDFSIRAQRAGFRLVVARRSVVHHRVSSGTGARAKEGLIAEAACRLTARYFPWLLPLALLVGFLTGLKRGLGRRQRWRVTDRLAGYQKALARSTARTA